MSHSVLMDRTVQVDLGLEIADSDFRELSYSRRERILKIIFMTGLEQPEHLVEVTFTDAVAFRLQEAEFSIGGNDPCNDYTYEVLDSTLLAKHLGAGYVYPQQNLRHFKFSFGGSTPTLEVLCGSVSHRIPED